MPEHGSLKDEISHKEVSCISDGCHGPAHPFSKDIKPEEATIGEKL
ncbi:MAG: hypothetical protein IPJ88_16835 [Myxococcales bacterium]|nr:MAG: hypothetical protein IPJ88_16835 [Myxococcales bacterium]